MAVTDEAKVARDLPETTFVLDHLSKPPIAAGELEPWASRIRELAAAATYRLADRGGPLIRGQASEARSSANASARAGSW